MSVFVDEMGRFVSFSRKNIGKGYNFAADLVKTDRMVQKEVKQEWICDAGVGNETCFAGVVDEGGFAPSELRGMPGFGFYLVI